MGGGGGGGGGGGEKTPPPQNLPHISYKDETWHSYTLPNQVPKIYESGDTTPELYWLQRFFAGNQQTLLYEEIQIKIAFW